MLYSRLLNYYLDSDLFFRVYKEMFFEDIHFGICAKERYIFKSEIYKNIEKRLSDEGGYILLLSDKKIQEYFTQIGDEYQLSAVIFGEWYGLNQKQLRQVADRRSPRLSWKKINYFICNPNEKIFPKNYNCEQDMKKLTYYIQTENTIIPARYDVKFITNYKGERLKSRVLVDKKDNNYIFETDCFYNTDLNTLEAKGI